MTFPVFLFCMKLPGIFSSECWVEDNTYAVFLSRRQIQIVDSSDVLYLNQVENILHAHGIFHIRTFAVQKGATFREKHQKTASGIPLKNGIVLCGKSAP